jgi:hypothetical protein
MTTTILTALGALITGLITTALMVSARDTAARAASRAERSGRTMPQTRSLGTGR